MNDDIIRMARQAGIDAEKDTLCRYEGWVEPLERFFHLAFAAGAAAEREAILQMSRDQWFKTQADFEEAIRARGKQE